MEDYKFPIVSILDNDLYKFTMQNAVLKLFPRAKVKYNFILRDKSVKFPPGFANQLRVWVRKMEELQMTQEEEIWMSKQTDKFIDPSYIEMLSKYRYDSSEVGIIQKGGELHIEISGYWFRTVLWEVILMALISELYFLMTGQKSPFSECELEEKNQNKASFLARLAVLFADFGTRRRYSYENHKKVVETLKSYGRKAFVGTSNVHLAMMFDVKPIGTHAHEWFMFHAAKYGFRSANHEGLKNWKKVYKGHLGVALSDTFTTKEFFKAFNKEFAETFSGVRHDSGDAIEFADKVIKHYKDLDIDPKSKTIVFSDGLNLSEVERIIDHCRHEIKCSFGIGTFFTNDVGVKALNMVIKMVEAEPYGQSRYPTVKLSDSIGKFTGNIEMVKLACVTLELYPQLEKAGLLEEDGSVKINFNELYGVAA